MHTYIFTRETFVSREHRANHPSFNAARARRGPGVRGRARRRLPETPAKFSLANLRKSLPESLRRGAERKDFAESVRRAQHDALDESLPVILSCSCFRWREEDNPVKTRLERHAGPAGSHVSVDSSAGAESCLR